MNGSQQNDVLCHHGVLGMHWGRHMSGRKTSSSGKKSGHKKSTNTGSKKLSEMSDNQIRKRIGRMQLEKQYKSLIKELNPDTINKGEKEAQSSFKKATKDIALNSYKNIGQQTLTYILGKGVNKILGNEHDHSPINPKKGQKDK